MRSVLRRHPFVALAAALVLLVVAGVATAPWWIDLGPVRAKIASTASAALAGHLTYERMDLSWFPHPDVVVRGLRISAPGTVQGAARTVRVSPALGSLLRGKVVITKFAVDGLDLSVTLDAAKDTERGPAPPGPDWTQALRSLGSQTLDIELNRSRVVLSRPRGRSLAFDGIRLEASLRSADGKAGLTLSRLTMDSPRLVVEGSLRADASARILEAAAQGSALDVTDVRGKLLSFAGDDPTVESILAIVRGGTLTSFSFASSGQAPGDLGALERMTIRAAVKDAKVRVPGPELDLADVTADVALEGGALTAANAAARVGKSRAEGGKVLVGLARGDDRLRVDTRVKADLAEVLAILARVIPSRSFREEVALVEGLQGSATGRLTLGDRKADLQTSVAVSKLELAANYRRLPWPLRVDGGEFTFDGKRVGVNRLSGRVGRSTFSGLAARVRLGRGPVLESGSSSIGVSLEDFFEGVRTRPGAEALARNVRRVSGSVFVDVQRLAGPLARLGEASVTASGTFKDILFSSSSLPPLSIASGRFAVSDDAIRVSDAAARSLDASLLVSGAWSGWRDGASTIDASTDGTLGPEAIRWGWTLADLPSEFQPAAPIALHGVHVSRTGGGALSVAGDLVVANGPRLTLDLAGDGKKIDVRNLTVADGDTRVSAGLLRPEGSLDVRFKGRLDVSTLAKLFSGREWHGGAIEGDFRALIPAENPGGLTAEGTLMATNFDVSTPAGPVTLEHLDVRAAQNRFDVASSSLVLDEQRFSFAGGVTLREGGVSLDLGSLAWRGYVWKPVLADVRFGKEVLVTIRKADVCGISTAGQARFPPGGAMAVDARADAAGPDINVPLTCLGMEKVGMTGSYEASVQVRGEAPASELPRALRGPLTFKAEKGGIGETTVLTRILGVLNATDVFKGESKTRVGDAIPYDAITVDGELAEGRVAVREAALKAPSITMAATGTVGFLDKSLDLMVLSHPLSTIDKIVQAIPVVRHILGRNFLAVAVKVTGTIADPKVTITPGRDVGKGLVGILERTVTLPVKVFDPPAPEGR